MKSTILAAALALIGGLFMMQIEDDPKGSSQESSAIAKPSDQRMDALYYPPSVTEDASEARRKLGYIRN